MLLNNHLPKRIIISVLFFILLLCIFYSNQTLIRAEVPDNTSQVVQFQTPSEDAINTWGIYYKSGIDQQLPSKTDLSTTVDTPIYLYVEFARSVWDWVPESTPHYTWHEKIQNGKWGDIKSNNSNSITVKPDSTGVSYYQLEVSYHNDHGIHLLAPLILYSKVVTIHTVPKKIPTNSISIDTGSDYLYNKTNDFNNTSTYATATTEPYNSTENILWLSDNPNLATIDNNGKVVANNKGLSGDVWIQAYAKNSDLDIGPVYSPKKKIVIGGGLEDKKAHIGENVTFKILGLGSNNNTTNGLGKTYITWYKVGQKEGMKTNNTSYTIENVANKNNGERFYATITTVFKKKNGNIIKKTFTTNEATLTVIPSNNPDVDITTEISNENFKCKSDTDKILNNVIKNDPVNYTITLNNKSNQPLTNSILTIPIHKHSMIQNIKLDKADVTDTYLDNIKSANDNMQALSIHINKLDRASQKIINIETTIQDIAERDSSISTVKLTGIDFDNKNYENNGPETKINYLNNKLNPSSKNISFESISPFESNTLKHRLDDTNYPNNIISFDDQRRNKKSLVLSLSGTGKLVDSSKKLNAELQFYSKDHGVTSLQNGPIIIERSQKDEPFSPVHWERNEGLLLKTGRGPMIPGHYCTELTWNITDGPK